jgi:glycosyltransferase involved in cell wall biosynthesis
MILSFADAVVSVSNGVADDLAQCAGVPREDITVIHNGVVTTNVDRLASAEPAHPWFAGETPVIVAMGRLVPQKDFKTLLAALASVQDSCCARLLVLGEGPMRAELESLATSLGLADRVAFPGFVDNPWPYLSRADLFVLSSRFEGLPNVIVEALACGTPVVSTNCPHGPFEILDGGRYGVLVPVGDPTALGEAILSALSRSVDREQLKRRGRAFNVESCGAAYRELIGRIAPPKR